MCLVCNIAERIFFIILEAYYNLCMDVYLRSTSLCVSMCVGVLYKELNGDATFCSTLSIVTFIEYSSIQSKRPPIFTDVQDYSIRKLD